MLAAVAEAGKEGGARLLTHCNAGSLATAAYGTALGVVRATAEQGQLLHAYCTETRPYNQGADVPVSVCMGGRRGRDLQGFFSNVNTGGKATYKGCPMCLS